jgi:hypothetical protein
MCSAGPDTDFGIILTDLNIPPPFALTCPLTAAGAPETQPASL